MLCFPFLLVVYTMKLVKRYSEKKAKLTLEGIYGTG